MRVDSLAAAATALVLTGGCATIAHGTRQSVTITSDPSGAQVTVLTKAPGRDPVLRSTPGPTPITLQLTRRDPHIVIRIDKDGCAPVEIQLKRTVSGWVALNLLSLNPLAQQGMNHANYPLQVATNIPLTFGVDFLSGGAYKLPTVVNAPPCGR